MQQIGRVDLTLGQRHVRVSRFQASMFCREGQTGKVEACCHRRVVLYESDKAAHPSKHETFNQCWFKFWPTVYVGSMSLVCWDSVATTKLTLSPSNYSIWIFTHLKLCLADAIHNFKWVKIIQIWQNGGQLFSNIADWCHILSLTCLKGGT